MNVIKRIESAPVLFALLTLPLSGYGQTFLLRNSQAVDDEFRGYCFDVAGSGANARVEEPLRVHTCKYTGTTAQYSGTNSDQLFQWRGAGSGQIHIPEFDRCLTTNTFEAGTQLMLEACGNSERHAWSFGPTGRLSPESAPELCVTIADERLPAGTPVWISPVYHRRDLSLEPCDEAVHARQSWRWAPAVEQPPSLVETRTRTLPDQIVAGIREIGHQMSPDNMAKTQALLSDLPRAYDIDEIEVVADLAYGPHARHRLDVHTGKFRRSPSPMPVVMFFHGGGFIFGAKENERNVADYFASLGMVGVNATYRLAPDAPWPGGALDVGAAVTWVKENIADHGGDPDKIFVVGKSAGVEHVATYLFRPELLPQDTAAPAGAIFISGTFTPNVENPSRGELTYYGDDKSQWAARGTLGNISRSDIPVLVTVSEYDPPIYRRALAMLIHELTIEHGRMPRVAQLAGHNHYSTNASIGTVERAVSAQIVEMVRSVGAE